MYHISGDDEDIVQGRRVKKRKKRIKISFDERFKIQMINCAFDEEKE